MVSKNIQGSTCGEESLEVTAESCVCSGYRKEGIYVVGAVGPIIQVPASNLRLTSTAPL